jgi:hypothetical protein
VCQLSLQFKARASAGQCEHAQATQSIAGELVRQYMEEARDRVMWSRALLQSPGRWGLVRPLYKFYFLSKLEPGGSFNEVLERLVLTMNGLNNTIRVRVVEKLPQGAYNTNPGIAMVERAGRGSEGVNEIRDLRTGNMQRYADIILEKGLVDPTSIERVGLGYDPIKTLIHEATHKFAGTIDYCYFSRSDGSLTKATMGDESGGARKFGATAFNKGGPELARMNADSFAWFCYKVGEIVDFRGKALSSPRGMGGVIG